MVKQLQTNFYNVYKSLIAISFLDSQLKVNFEA